MAAVRVIADTPMCADCFAGRDPNAPKWDKAAKEAKVKKPPLTAEEKRERKRERQRAWRAAHREKDRESWRRYYAAHREAMQARSRKYWAAQSEEMREKRREYMRLYMRRWYAAAKRNRLEEAT